MARFEGHTKNIQLGKGVIVGAFATMYCHREGSIEIGDGAYIGDGVLLHTGKRRGAISIGKHSTVQTYSIVYGHGGCRIGNDVRIAAHTVLIPANHRFGDTSRPMHEQGLDMVGIFVEDDVWVGTGATILDGLTIGKGAIIAAGSVVKGDVQAMSIVGGVPARQIGARGDSDRVVANVEGEAGA
jgi:acetyltransferase-like isoleucine patch superfamily enzyme